MAAKKKTAKKKSARVVPKVSPLRGMSPDAWADRLDGWQKDALKMIRALVERHAPKATLSIKWGQSVWESNGPFAWAKPAAKHFSLGFWRGAELADPKGLLEGSGDRMRHVKITSADEIAKLPIGAWVKQAVTLNAKKGNPAAR